MAEVTDLEALIQRGEAALNVDFRSGEELVKLAQGSFAIAQYMCEQALQASEIRETQDVTTTVQVRTGQLVARSLELLQPQFHPVLQAFAMLDRGVPRRGAALILLRGLGGSEDGTVVLPDVRARFPEYETAFVSLLSRAKIGTPDLDWSAPWWESLYFSQTTGILALDDPKLHFYLKHLDWPSFWENCGIAVPSVPNQEELREGAGQVESRASETVDSGIKYKNILDASGDGVVRILHLSDLHFSDRQRWDSEVVLARLVDDVARAREEYGGPHLVVVTGDVAFSASREEYALAKAWLTELLRVARVETSELLIVSGNHDFSLPSMLCDAPEANQTLLPPFRTVRRLPCWQDTESFLNS
jgi:hypothetical protein